ncbi:hypothetical protein KOR42_39280 [Thalassoglobus neptunius]|uniref:Uncharacterized protein n=1 Tax=Thalassoglobus neptunius TaxID=1938619 RepID=A0A5C5WGU6_9PLAN|nr:hypothetical protein [Thalassoglobus neptunius]TWT49012.1 hypothetical protein KOR42_39280 [Thalassoglobus neptunius]
MTQTARPTSDITVNDWTRQDGAGFSLYTTIDEVTPSDSDYVQSSDSVNDHCEFALDALDDPMVASGHVLRCRYKKSSSGGNSRDLRFALYQGATQIASRTDIAISDAWTTELLTLSAGEANAITDYSDLRVRLEAFGTVAGGSSRRVNVSAVWLEVPDAGGLLISGSAAISSSSSATGTLHKMISGTCSISSSGSASLSDIEEFSGTATISSNGAASGSLVMPIQSTALITSDGSAELQLRGALSGSALITSESSASGSLVMPLSASLEISSSSSALATVTLSVSASSLISSDGSASLSDVDELVGTAAITSSGSASGSLVMPIQSTALITSDGSASLEIPPGMVRDLVNGGLTHTGVALINGGLIR